MLRSWILAAFVLLAAPSAAAEFKIDMAGLRHLADEMPGAKPADIRVETVGYLPFTWDLVVDGAEKTPVKMALLSYQLVFPDRTAVIDVAMDKAMADQWEATGWDDAASARLDAAMGKADLILITHEHADHIGRLVSRATDKALFSHVKLTAEQAAGADYMQPLKWPEGALTGYTPFSYDGAAAVAPGVVVMKAPGHTPGSQLVFVKTAGGQEFLFLGDAVWQWRNIAEGKSRSAESVKQLHEDDTAVKAQLAEFQRLAKEEPGLIMVPGHDGALVQKLVADGRLISEFKQ